MGKLLKKVGAAALCLTLLFALLPATGAAAVSGADMRQSVVRRTQAIMNVEWTLKTRVAKTDVLGDAARSSLYYSMGIWPTTYFEYPRLRFVLRGVMMDPRPATLEEFTALADPGAAVVPGIGHITAPNDGVRGMSVDSFLTDVTSRILPAPVAGVKAALTDAGLTALASGANLTAASSKAALGSPAAAKAGYAKLDAGDLLLAYDDQADPEKAPRLHAMVVKSADAAREQVTVMYPSYDLVVWHFVCDTCGATDTEGPTSAPLPVHVNSSSSASFVSYKKHAETDANTTCSGTWKSTYGTTWRTETVTFDQLYNGGAPGAGQGYLPYTCKAYATGADAAQVNVSTDFSAQTYYKGFSASVSSNYRMTALKAVLSKDNGQKVEATVIPALGATKAEFSDVELDRALLDCPVGSSNNLSLYVRTGPISAADAAQDDYHLAFSSDFRVDMPCVGLTATGSYCIQGEPFQVGVKALQAGSTGLRAQISYDASLLELDLSASRAASPGAELTAENGTVTCQRFGAAMAAGDSVATLTFRPIRTGDFPITASNDHAWIRCVGAWVTSKAGAGASDLAVGLPNSAILPITIGYNARIYPGYAGGYDLILVFTATEAQRTNNRNSTVRLAYDGSAMYDVSSAKYDVDGDRFIRTYGFLARNASVSKVAAGQSACPVLTYSNDVNQSGVFDISDVQTTANVVSGRLALEGNAAKWLLADIDRNGKVDRNDTQALLNALMK